MIGPVEDVRLAGLDAHVWCDVASTVFLVQPSYLFGILSTLDYVVVRLVPSRDCGQCWAWEVCERVEE